MTSTRQKAAVKIIGHSPFAKSDWKLQNDRHSLPQCSLIEETGEEKVTRYTLTNYLGGILENSNGSTTKRTVEMTECFENEDGVEFAEKVPDDWQGQLDQMRRSQNQMRQSQLQMEHYQRQMQQSQIALIQEQRKLQGQIQQLLGAQVTKRTSPDGTLNSSLTDWDTQALIPPSASTDAPLHSSFTEWEA